MALKITIIIYITLFLSSQLVHTYNNYYSHKKDEVSLFEHSNFKGNKITYTNMREISWIGYTWNDQVSSIVIPTYTGVVTFTDREYRGEHKKYTRSVKLIDMNDYILSMVIIKKGCIAVFSGSNFTGRRKEYCEGQIPVRERFVVFRSYISYDSKIKISRSYRSSLNRRNNNYKVMSRDIEFERNGFYAGIYPINY